MTTAKTSSTPGTADTRNEASIGIMMLDAVAPFPPGSVGNPQTFTAPVRYQPLPGMTNDVMLSTEPAPHTSTVVQAAHQLIGDGASLLTSNCGFMLRYQRDLQNVVDVPVSLSSLLLIPLLQSVLPIHQKLGVVTASTKTMTLDFLASAGLSFDPKRLVVEGLDSAVEFNAAFVACVGTLDVPAVEAEIVEATKNMIAKDPSVGAVLLECSELPVYAAAVQRAVNLPIYDFTSLIELVAGGFQRSNFVASGS